MVLAVLQAVERGPRPKVQVEHQEVLVCTLVEVQAVSVLEAWK